MSDERPSFDLSVVEQFRCSCYDPLRGFDPRKLARSLDGFRVGRLRDLALVMDAQEERDDVLACVAPKAKSAVARHGWDIIVGETDGDEEAKFAQEQKKALRYFYNNLRVTSALDQDEVGGVSLLLRQMMDAKGKRYACHNIVWKTSGKGLYSATLWQVPLWFFENTTSRMRFLSTANALDGDEMAPEEWLITKGTGVSIACAVAWTFKHLSLRDWVIYCGRHGMPGIEGITDAQPGTPEWQRMVNAVAAAASEFAWVRNKSEEIKAIQFGAKGDIPYPKLVERMDRTLSALWRGSDLSTISAGQGQGQGASLQGDEAALIEQDDAQWLSETCQLKLDRLVIDYIFGPSVPALAYFQISGANRANVDPDLKVDEFALSHGHPISRRQFAERYSRPVPDPQDTALLTASRAPAAVRPFGTAGPASQPPKRSTSLP
jgi:phage gp29-like protein